MRDRQLFSRTLPTLALVAAILALAFTSTALAEDPVVSAGPLAAGGTTVSGSAYDDPSAAACIGDEQLDAGLSGSSLVVPTQTACAASSGESTSVSNTSTTSTGSTTSNTATSSGSSASSGGAAAGTVSAAEAVGLRIARVRAVMKGVHVTRTFRLFVTLRDRRGRLVRGAIVSVGRAPGRTATASGLRSVRSGKVGTAQIGVRVKRSQLGKRLYLRIAARTPKARAVVLRSVPLPRPR